MAESHWDGIADFWETQMGSNGDWFQKYVIYPAVDKILGEIQGKLILDVGCGNGHLSARLANRNAIVTAMDISEKMIFEAKKRKENIKFILDDITNPANHYDRIFDFIIFNNSIQDISDYKKALASAHSFLKKDGRLIIIVRHPCFHPTSSEDGWKIITKDKNFTTGYGLSCLLDYDVFEAEKFTMDDYYECSAQLRNWGGNNVYSNRRTLEDYFNAITESGINIAKVYEPKPIEEGKFNNENLYNLLNRIPNFIIFEGNAI